MSAQMAVLFVAKHEEATHIITMAPPAVRDAKIIVPVNHAAMVQAQRLLKTASDDEFSSKAENHALMNAGGDKLTWVEFDSRHRLPANFVDAVIDWVAKIDLRK